ncbi:MAG TPA: tetratricopeptide repeat protein, partial [Candidatus Aminicenantes bacterium]|nr:tetratricopeptide repeat protein [Candidatus Aminicenantes bacterium]
GRETNFTVSRLPKVPHPPVASPTLASEKGYVFLSMLAAQYENSGRPDEAQRAYEESLRQGGDNFALRVIYARFLLAQGKHERLLELIQPVKDEDKTAFDRHALRGKALYQLGRTQEAIDELIEANKLYDSDSTVLNTLGLSFLRLNNPQEARKALTASLKINAEQPEIAELLRKTEVP